MVHDAVALLMQDDLRSSVGGLARITRQLSSVMTTNTPRPAVIPRTMNDKLYTTVRKRPVCSDAVRRWRTVPGSCCIYLKLRSARSPRGIRPQSKQNEDDYLSLVSVIWRSSSAEHWNKLVVELLRGVQPMQLMQLQRIMIWYGRCLTQTSAQQLLAA